MIVYSDFKYRCDQCSNWVIFTVISGVKFKSLILWLMGLLFPQMTFRVKFRSSRVNCSRNNNV